MEATLSTDTLEEAAIAGAYVLLGTMLLASSMFVAYAARILRKWETQPAAR